VDEEEKENWTTSLIEEDKKEYSSNYWKPTCGSTKQI
jgi:hypothetical protein